VNSARILIADDLVDWQMRSRSFESVAFMRGVIHSETNAPYGNRIIRLRDGFVETA